MNADDFQRYADRRFKEGQARLELRDDTNYAHMTGTLVVLCAMMYERLSPEDRAFVDQCME